MPKWQLLRVVAGSAEATVDAQMNLPGRGAYVCSSLCLKAALDKGTLSRALGKAVSADPTTTLLREGVEYLSRLNEGADG